MGTARGLIRVSGSRRRRDDEPQSPSFATAITVEMPPGARHGTNEANEANEANDRVQCEMDLSMSAKHAAPNMQPLRVVGGSAANRIRTFANQYDDGSVSFAR